MSNDRNAFKAGLFIIISIVLIISVIIGIKGIGRLIEPYQVRTASFTLADDVGGLGLGDDVRVGGLKVGVVRSLDIVFDPKNPETSPTIFITFHIPKRLVLRDGAKLSVQSTVTGSSWLNFESIGAGNALKDEVVIVGQPGTFTKIFAAVNELAPELKKIASDVRSITLPKVNNTADKASDLLVSARSKLDNIVQRYDVLADRLAETALHMRDILGDTKSDIRVTMSNLSASTGTIKEKLPPMMDKITTVLGKVDTSLDKAQSSLENLAGTMDNAKDISANVREILTRNRSRIEAFIVSIKEAGDNLKFATAEVRRSPWRLLYKPRPGEMANLNLFDAAREFAEGANNMSDAAAALRDAAKDPNADPEMIQKLVDQLDERFGKFQQVEDALWQRVKD